MKWTAFTISLLTFSFLSAQKLKVGDRLPNLIFSQVINTKPQIEFADFRGKIIILDFWNHGCLACIKSFPVTDSLQILFRKEAQVLLINSESKDSTKKFFRLRKFIKPPKVPLICNEESFADRFEHYGFPFQVWLDTSWTIKYITSIHNLTYTNVIKFAKGERLNLVDYSQGTNEDIPDVLSQTDDENLLMYYSTISRYNKNSRLVAVNGKQIKNGKLVRLTVPRQSPIDLLVKAYSQNGKYNFKISSTVELVNVDSSLTKMHSLIFKAAESPDEWYETNTFTYDLIVPIARENNLYKYMQQDVSRVFNLEGKIEKKLIPCLNLIKVWESENLNTKGGKGVDSLVMSDLKKPISDRIRFLRNMPIGVLVRKLSIWSETALRIPIQNETGIKTNIDIAIDGLAIDELNMENIRKNLLKYGLDLKPGKCERDILVISNSKR